MASDQIRQHSTVSLAWVEPCVVSRHQKSIWVPLDAIIWIHQTPLPSVAHFELIRRLRSRCALVCGSLLTSNNHVVIWFKASVAICLLFKRDQCSAKSMVSWSVLTQSYNTATELDDVVIRGKVAVKRLCVYWGRQRISPQMYPVDNKGVNPRKRSK